MTRSTKRPHKRSIDVTLPPEVHTDVVSSLIELLDDPFYDGFKTQYLKQEILSKYCDPTTTPAAERLSNAIEKWRLAENRNRATNIRLMTGIDVDSDGNEHSVMICGSTWVRVRNLIRVEISRILGELPYPDILFTFGHTNGASTRVSRSPIAALEKLEGEVHITEAAIKHWLAVASKTPLSRQTLLPVPGSVLFTVPKNSDIDRVACKEPEGNVALQRSVGNYIRQRLRKVGIDLNDQSINQQLAKEASQKGHLATIDLSSASDSISSQLVFELLPFDWWSLLSDLRSERTQLPDGSVHEFEMFSSMGNGFTFELESLLFYAITRVVCRLSGKAGRISVYGDDIIAPAAVVPRLIRIFYWLGFRTNAKKTFWRGPFRESCGKHWYRGYDVSPFYIRRRVSTLPDLITLLNNFLKWDGRDYGFITHDLAVIWHRKFSSLIPQSLWGGVDPEDSTCLVTGHAPRKRLIPLMKDCRFSDDSAYVYWMMTKENMGEQSLHVDPRRQVGYKLASVSKGWYTSYKPWLIGEPSHD